MFGLKKNGPSQPTPPFEHAVGCTIIVADPGFQPEWQELEEGTGGGSANLGAKTATSHASTLEPGSTLWIRPPSATGRRARIPTLPIPSSSKPS